MGEPPLGTELRTGKASHAPNSEDIFPDPTLFFFTTPKERYKLKHCL